MIPALPILGALLLSPPALFQAVVGLDPILDFFILSRLIIFPCVVTAFNLSQNCQNRADYFIVSYRFCRYFSLIVLFWNYPK